MEASCIDPNAPARKKAGHGRDRPRDSPETDGQAPRFPSDRKEAQTMVAQGLAQRAKRTPSLRARLKYLYEGHNVAARLFRYAMLAFDLATIAFFLLTSGVEAGPRIHHVGRAA